jgi:hypothetical protein
MKPARSLLSFAETQLNEGLAENSQGGNHAGIEVCFHRTSEGNQGTVYLCPCGFGFGSRSFGETSG